ncbi:MAG: hydrogenase expression protein HypE, partial [Reyranellaceae bacterium]
MTALGDFLGGLPPEPDHRPFPRVTVSGETWRLASEALAEGALDLAGLWGDTAMVHMAVADPGCAEYAVLSLPCVGGTFPSVARLHPPALRLERTIADLYGYAAEGATDGRPWLDHGRWPVRPPLAARAHATPAASYDYQPAEGESQHQNPVGPVQAGNNDP